MSYFVLQKGPNNTFLLILLTISIVLVNQTTPWNLKEEQQLEEGEHTSNICHKESATKTCTQDSTLSIGPSKLEFRAQNQKMSRSVKKSVLSKWQDEGVGARVRRSVGMSQVGSITVLQTDFKALVTTWAPKN